MACGWRHGSGVKNTGCSSRGTWVAFPEQTGLSVILVPETQASLLVANSTAHSRCTDTPGLQNTKNKNILPFAQSLTKTAFLNCF